MNAPLEQDLRYTAILAAANSHAKVGSLTHSFYRYPARFGETFVREVIQNFSEPGDIVLDPFCGGGTTVVEALAAGRRAWGADISALATFVATVKSTPLSRRQLNAVQDWCEEVASSVASLLRAHPGTADDRLERLPSSFKRVIANLKSELEKLPRGDTRRLATCLLLKTSQWAFDGKEYLPSPTDFVRRLPEHFAEMRLGLESFAEQFERVGYLKADTAGLRKVCTSDAGSLSLRSFDATQAEASLVVTSPPYLGVHVLYNRWQLQGRRELKVPFYLVDCQDLGFPSKYTILPRASSDHNTYFSVIARSFGSVRKLLKPRAYVVQLVSFGDAFESLSKYLDAMNDAGMDLCETYLHTSGELNWRAVPGRRWYARVGAAIDSSAAEEVLLVHRSRG